MGSDLAHVRRHRVRLVVFAVLVALASFVVLHDVDFASIGVGETPSMRSHETDQAVHPSMALCALALVVALVLILPTPRVTRPGVNRSVLAMRRTSRRPDRARGGSLLYELCVLRA